MNKIKTHAHTRPTTSPRKNLQVCFFLFSQRKNCQQKATHKSKKTLLISFTNAQCNEEKTHTAIIALARVLHKKSQVKNTTQTEKTENNLLNFFYLIFSKADTSIDVRSVRICLKLGCLK